LRAYSLFHYIGCWLIYFAVFPTVALSHRRVNLTQPRHV